MAATYILGPFRLDVETDTLFRGGEPGIDVGPQPRQKVNQDSKRTTPHQTCWWTRLDANPSLSRQTSPPVQRRP